MTRRGRRDRRAQRRGAVEALVRAGWSEAEVQVLLDLAADDGLEPSAVALALLVPQERPAWEDEDDEEGWGPCGCCGA